MSLPFSIGRLLLVLSVVLSSYSTLHAATSTAGDPASPSCGSEKPVCEVRPQDTLWLLSTRRLGCPDCGAAESPAIEAFRWNVAAEDFVPAAWNEFLSDTGPDTITVVFCDGNRISWSEAIESGLRAYFALTAGAAESAPIRFVIWSWPSDHIHGVRRDIMTKAARTDVEAFYLAHVLAQLGRDAKVGLFGFSFGARIVSGALHIAAGGEICGWQLPPEAAAETPAVRAALMAPATHNFWLLPGEYHGAAIERIDGLLIQYNSRDKAFKWYPRMDRRSRPEALGYTGMNVSRLGEAADRIEQVNVAWATGNSHDLDRFLDSCELMLDVQRYVLWRSL